MRRWAERTPGARQVGSASRKAWWQERPEETIMKVFNIWCCLTFPLNTRILHPPVSRLPSIWLGFFPLVYSRPSFFFCYSAQWKSTCPATYWDFPHLSAPLRESDKSSRIKHLSDDKVLITKASITVELACTCDERLGVSVEHMGGPYVTAVLLGSQITLHWQ